MLRFEGMPRASVEPWPVPLKQHTVGRITYTVEPDGYPVRVEVGEGFNAAFYAGRYPAYEASEAIWSARWLALKGNHVAAQRHLQLAVRCLLSWLLKPKPERPGGDCPACGRPRG